jgi:hypothetical protein
MPERSLFLHGKAVGFWMAFLESHVPVCLRSHVQDLCTSGGLALESRSHGAESCIEIVDGCHICHREYL